MKARAINYNEEKIRALLASQNLAMLKKGGWVDGQICCSSLVMPFANNGEMSSCLYQTDGHPSQGGIMNGTARTQVYIVEDELFFIEIYTKEINRDPLLEIVGIAQNGFDAIEFLKSNHVDLLVCDLMLPDMLGTNVISLAKSFQPLLKVLVITGVGTEDNLLNCLAMDVKGFIQKDELPANLSSLLSDVQQGYASISPHVASEFLSAFKHQAITGDERRNPLTSRELDVLKALSMGYSVKSTAQKLDISPYTVSDHTKSIYLKLEVRSRMQAVAKMQKRGWLN